MFSWGFAVLAAWLCTDAISASLEAGLMTVQHWSPSAAVALHAAESTSQGHWQLAGNSLAAPVLASRPLKPPLTGFHMPWHRHKVLKRHSRPHLQVHSRAQGYNSSQQQQPGSAAQAPADTGLETPGSVPLSAISHASGEAPHQEGVWMAVADPAAGVEAAKVSNTLPYWLLPQSTSTKTSANSYLLPQESRPGCGALTVEKVAAAAANFTIMLVVTDYSTTPDFLHHWLGNVKTANIGYYLVASTDDATDEHLVQSGLTDRCYRLAGTSHRGRSQGYHWSSNSWKEATWRKVPAAQELLAMGYSVVMSDIDVMWLADPLPFMLNQTEADFLVSVDAHYTDVAEGELGLEPGFSLGRLMNTGVYFARAKIQVLDLYQQWLSYQHAHNHDQEGFKLLSAAVGGPVVAVPGTTRLGRVFKGRIVMGHLPVTRFMHSYSYSVMQLHKEMNTIPFEVHMVFGYGHRDSKVYRLRDAGLGHDPLDSEYYHPPGGLLSFDLVAPEVPAGFTDWASKDLSHTEDEMEIMHNRAVDYQLQQLYHALGLALALNRPLIMPEMLCFCARGWYPNDVCRLAGDSRTLLPFRCTGDQVFNLEAISNPEMLVAGSKLRVRPPSFAADSRLPSHFAESMLRLTPVRTECSATVRRPIWRCLATASPAVASACGEEQQQKQYSHHNYITLPREHAAEDMAQLFSNYSAVPWLHFTNITVAFAGFKVQANQQAFSILLTSIAAEWCCRSANRVVATGVADGHLHRIRQWGSTQRFCSARTGGGHSWDRVHTYFC